MTDSFDAAPIVVLSSIDWDAAWQRHQIFAAQFAEAGRDVFFVENSGFRNPGLSDAGRVFNKLKRKPNPVPQENANLHLVSPKVLPPTFGAFRRANAAWLIPKVLRILRSKGLRQPPIVVAYFATATTLEMIRRLDPALLVYDCASNFRAHPRAQKDFPALENELLCLADLVVCDSDYLFQQKAAEHPNVVQIHQGVSERFLEAAGPAGHWRSFCYYGTWGPDLEPAYPAALAEAGFDVTISGYAKGPQPSFPASIKRLAPTTLEDLPRRLERFEGFLMPYRVTPFHLGVVPAKIYECLALGRPVIATPLPSLQSFSNLIYIAEKPSDWVKIARSLPKTETASLREARVALAREHTHAREFSRLAAKIRAAWEKKRG